MKAKEKKMPIYRPIQTSFWQDSYILSLSPEEKYFYIYLLTNSMSKQCGIFEMPIQIVEVETKFKKEKIFKFISKFEMDGKIKFNQENCEVMIINWIKYHWSESGNVKKCISNELKEVKTKEYIDKFLTLCKQSAHSLDTPAEIKRNIKTEEIENKNSDINSVDNSPPLTRAAKFCFDANGPNCRLKGKEEKCKFCINVVGRSVNLKN